MKNPRENERNAQHSAPRATFAEVFASIRFEHKPSANDQQKSSTPGFATNRSLHNGVAAPDDYKQVERSSN